MDPSTQEPGLPAGTFYDLTNALDANDDFVWQDLDEMINITGWISQGNTSSAQLKMTVDARANRRLDPPDQLWLVLHSDLILGSSFPVLFATPFLRTLLSDRPVR